MENDQTVLQQWQQPARARASFLLSSPPLHDAARRLIESSRPLSRRRRRCSRRARRCVCTGSSRCRCCCRCFPRSVVPRRRRSSRVSDRRFKLEWGHGLNFAVCTDELNVRTIGFPRSSRFNSLFGNSAPSLGANIEQISAVGILGEVHFRGSAGSG
jgi:hypothetical protein